MRSSFERFVFPNTPDMLMKLRSAETTRKTRLLLVLAAAMPRKMVSAM